MGNLIGDNEVAYWVIDAAIVAARPKEMGHFSHNHYPMSGSLDAHTSKPEWIRLLLQGAGLRGHDCSCRG